MYKILINDIPYGISVKLMRSFGRDSACRFQMPCQYLYAICTSTVVDYKRKIVPLKRHPWVRPCWPPEFRLGWIIWTCKWRWSGNRSHSRMIERWIRVSFIRVSFLKTASTIYHSNHMGKSSSWKRDDGDAGNSSGHWLHRTGKQGIQASLAFGQLESKVKLLRCGNEIS